MKPGEILTCANPHCGAQARATSTRPENWKEDYPLILAWPDGRTHVTAHRPDRCLSCHERFEVLGMDTPPPRPVGPMRELATVPVLEVLAERLQQEIILPCAEKVLDHILPARKQLTLF
jgi:hypothetical protein